MDSPLLCIHKVEVAAVMYYDILGYLKREYDCCKEKK